MRMKVQGRLMQARFIEIHQVFAKTKGHYDYTYLIVCSIDLIDNIVRS